MKPILAGLCLGLLVLAVDCSGSAAAQTRATATVRLVDTLSSGSSQRGDTFTAKLATPLVVRGRIVADKDATVIGQVRDVISSGRLKRPAVITLSLLTIQAPTGRVPMQTDDILGPLSERTRLSLAVLRPRIKSRRED